MPFQALLENLLSGLAYYRYVLTFVLAIFEGPMVMVASGILLRLGFFYFLPVYFSLMLGDFVADLAWYWVGYYGGRPFVDRFGKYFSLTPDVVEKIEDFFHKHQDKILVISKLTMGFGFAVATLFTAGLVKVNFKKYALFNFFGGFIWTGVLLAAGYFFGNLYAVLNRGFKVVFIIALSVFMVGLLYGGGKYFKQLLLKNKL
ncbi:MAG: DedA family protein [Candidatus Doudnabacteria bacterium]|nr:DedA family protein [Candidatus Doudnabacteria bacterium]